MAQINMRFSRPSADGTLAPATGSLAWTPSLRHTADGSSVVLPLGFTVQAAAIPFHVTVEPSGNDWVWKVVESFDGLPRRTVYLAVPNVAEVNYADLVVVDRNTLAPSAAPEPAWWATADAIVESGAVVADHLILTRRDGTTVDAGNVRGLPGTPGTPGTNGHNPITVSTTAPDNPADNDLWFHIS